MCVLNIYLPTFLPIPLPKNFSTYMHIYNASFCLNVKIKQAPWQNQRHCSNGKTYGQCQSFATASGMQMPSMAKLVGLFLDHCSSTC